jgi:hypothetical protein
MGGGGGGNKQDFEQSARFAHIARALWSDQAKRFWPREEELTGRMMTEEADAKRFTGMATDTTNRMFANQQGAMTRDMARYGVTPTAVQTAASQRTLDMARTGVLANTRNAARLGVKDQNMGVMAGGLTTNARNIQTMMGAK